MTAAKLRHQFMREFRRLTPHTRALAGITVASYLLQTLAAIAAGWGLLQLELSALTAAGLGMLMLFIGTRLRGLNNIVHECSHFTFCDRREDNVVWGSVCAALILGCFRDYREEHMTHHVNVGDYDLDRDLHRIRDLRIEEPLTSWVVLRHLGTVAVGRHLPYYINVNLSSRDGRLYSGVKAGLIGLAIMFLLLDPVAAVLLVWLPFLWVFTSINYLTDCIDHAGLIGAEDDLDSSRNLPLPMQLRFLLFPRNDCFHLVHHLFPQVPARHLDTCHERLLSDPDYAARVPVSFRGRGGRPTQAAQGAEVSVRAIIRP